MFKKIKKFWEKIEPSFSAILTILFFTALSILNFLIFKDSQIFKNNLLNLITIILSQGIIDSFFIYLCYKSIKFIFTKPTLSEKEFDKLWKKRWKIAVKLKKGQKEKKRKYGSKEFKKRYEEMNKIDGKLMESTIKFKGCWFNFFIFSIYFGLLEGIPFWAIKHSGKYFWKSVKEYFSKKPFGTGFIWYKLKEGKYLIGDFIYPINKIRK